MRSSLLLACLAAPSSHALAGNPEPSSDPLTAGEAAWEAGDYDGARAYFESAATSLINRFPEHGAALPTLH